MTDHIISTPTVGAKSGETGTVTLSIHGNDFEMKPVIAHTLADRLHSKAILADKE